jgi:hypothetical protein
VAGWWDARETRNAGHYVMDVMKGNVVKERQARFENLKSKVSG